MADLADGESVKVQGSGSKPYELKNTGGVYSCSCPAWRNQSTAIERRTCKHLRAFRGDAAEESRTGGSLPQRSQASPEAVTAAPVLLAEGWDGVSDPAGWWMSEKLDGIRAYWNGKVFLSRLGNPFYAPDWFIEGLPTEPLDGELWLARKAFQRTSGIVRRQDKSDLWKEIRYLVFDAPEVDAVFEERLDFVNGALREHPYATPHAHILCSGVEQLKQELSRIESLGGEGLMLRQPGSRYVAGRSTTLLKVKTFKDDEARVVGHQPGAGRHKGRLGALLVRMGDGTQFAVGTGFSDRQRENPPPVGSLITFRYQELSDGGVPRFPSFVRLRSDVEMPSKQASTEASLPTSLEPEVEPDSYAVPAEVSVQSQDVPAPANATQAQAATSSIGTRRFEMVDGASDKFWEISVSGVGVTVRYGRSGTQGQANTKNFSDVAAAAAHAQKLIKEKTGKGYNEVNSR